MEPAADNGSGSGLIAGACAGRDWSGLPEDLLVSVLQALHVADVVRSGAVCASWRTAYAAFRRLRVPSPRQPPCLLYASDALAGHGAAALHCPATGATLRKIPFPLGRRPLLGSGHGWLAIADEVSNLHLVNPVTGAHAALPPITAIHNVKLGTDEQGAPAYNVYENLATYRHGRLEVDTEPTILDMDKAYKCVYYRVVLSASPSSGRACVVLLLHMPYGQVSFARLGDDRWTWVTPAGRYYCDAMYNATNGLFYLLQKNARMCSLDLSGSMPVVGNKVLNGVTGSAIDPIKYLVQTPAGDILQVWRSREYTHSTTPVDIPPYYVPDDVDLVNPNPYLELNTLDVKIYKVDLHGQRMELVRSLTDYALFLGLNGSMCLPIEDFPGLKSNCAYITDDFLEYVNFNQYNRREIGIWSMAEQSMSKLADVSPSWLNWPSPIWIVPSLF